MRANLNVFFRLSWVVIVVMVASSAGALADESDPNRIDFRWVLAGLAKDAAPFQLVNLSSDASLHSGDKLKVYLKTRSKCFFYLLHRDPHGRLTLLYPSSLPTHALEPGTQITLPVQDQWFELDEQIGTETFHVLVSPVPLRSVETLYAEYREQGARSGPALTRLLSVIERLSHQQRPLTSKAERPVSIGGTIRGGPDKDPDVILERMDRLAEDIVLDSAFCRTYTIEHH